MASALSLPYRRWSPLFPVVLLGALLTAIYLQLFELNRQMAIAISIDLLIILPVLYFFCIRKSVIPTITVVPFLAICLFSGLYFLPEGQRDWLLSFKTFGLPVIELIVLVHVILIGKKVLAQLKSESVRGVDFYDALAQVLSDKPAIIRRLLMTELSVIYYGLIKWKKSNFNFTAYSMHKGNGVVAVLAAVLLLIAVETAAIHLLLAKWSESVAWILSIISIYTGLQLFGLMKSLSYRPSFIDREHLHLRFGIGAEAQIALEDIESVSKCKGDLPDEARNFSILGALDQPNLLLTFKKEQWIFGLYGKKSKTKKLALQIDRQEDFCRHLNEKLCA